MKASWKQNRSTTMLQEKREAGRGSRHSKLGYVIKIVTTRHICLSVIAVLCCLSFILPLSRFTVQPSTMPTYHSNVSRLVAFSSDFNATTNIVSPVNDDEGKKEDSDSMAKILEGASKDVHEPDALLAGNEAIESTTIDPLRISFVNDIMKYVKKTKARYGTYYNQSITLLPEQNKGVIIVTNHRSGSTFLGELFNQHPDAFYTFEPLFPLDSQYDHQTPLKLQILNGILKCDFMEIKELFEKITLPFKKNHVATQCLIDNFCFRKKTADLCDKKLCPFGRLPGCNRCGPLHLPRVKNACRAKKMSVIKTIRICDINQLKTIAMDPTLDFKIIHLVRDPRGIESSRMKIHKRWPLHSDSEETCNRLLHNAMSGQANTSATEWMKGRYMRIRYEDLALKTLSYAEKIYQFVGLEFVEKVKVWIMQNTHPDSGVGATYRQKKNRKSPYGTTRNSTAAMEAWRKHLNFEQVSKVQSKCMRVLSYFGYKPVHSEKELHNFDEKLVR